MNKDLSPNTTLSHYRIVSKLGAGGMGEVFLAHDERLDRNVALTILPAAIAADQKRMQRFVREAKPRAIKSSWAWRLPKLVITNLRGRF